MIDNDELFLLVKRCRELRMLGIEKGSSDSVLKRLRHMERFCNDLLKFDGINGISCELETLSRIIKDK